MELARGGWVGIKVTVLGRRLISARTQKRGRDEERSGEALPDPRTVTQKVHPVLCPLNMFYPQCRNKLISFVHRVTKGLRLRFRV
jgi:hypothetical protein